MTPEMILNVRGGNHQRILCPTPHFLDPDFEPMNTIAEG